MTFLQERFNRLADDEQDALLEFLDNITEGEIRDVCRDQLMSNHELAWITSAHDKFKSDPNE